MRDHVVDEACKCTIDRVRFGGEIMIVCCDVFAEVVTIVVVAARPQSCADVMVCYFIRIHGQNTYKWVAYYGHLVVVTEQLLSHVYVVRIEIFNADSSAIFSVDQFVEYLIKFNSWYLVFEHCVRVLSQQV